MVRNSQLRSFSSRSGLWLGGGLGLVLFLGCTGWAQSTTAAASGSPMQKQAVAAHVRHHRARPKTQKPPSPSDEAANPPQVTLDQGKLLVDAHNSDLSTILQDVAAQSGMTVDGLSRNTRVFGVYGPGAPRDVLSQLLTGAGYNFVMVGGAQENVPRELLLTAQNGNAMPPNPTRGTAQEPSQTDEEQNGEPLGPGAIAHPSPQDQDTDEDNSEERMQQRLKNLQQMQKMMQQNQPPQQPQPNQDNQPPQPQ